MKRFVIYLIVLALVSGLSMFTSFQAYSQNGQDTLVILCETEAVSLDPAQNSFGYSRIKQRMAYESLVELHKTKTGKVKVVPGLAKNWRISDDGKTYTFYLEKGVKFTDGTDFNAQAVKFNMERYLALGLQASEIFKPLRPIEVKVVDEYTVSFHLKHPYAPFLNSLSYLLIVSPTAVKQHEKNGDWAKEWLNDHMVGTGPYLLEKWEPGNIFIARRNRDYWRGIPPFKRIVERMVPEETTRKEMLLRGDADLIRGVSHPTSIEEIEKAEGVVLETQTGVGEYQLTFKIRGRFKDPLVRKAFLYAFPYKAFWENVMQGRGWVPRGPLQPPVFGYDPYLPKMHQDLKKAQELLAQAGYPDGFEKPIQLNIISAYKAWYTEMAEALQRNLAKIGIELKIKDVGSVSTYLDENFTKDVNKGPDLYAWGYASRTGYDFISWRKIYHSDSIPMPNGGHYKNATFDKLMNKAYRTGDEDVLRALFREMQRVLLDDPPAIWIGVVPWRWARKEALKGLHVALNDNSWGNPYYWHFETGE